MPIFVGVPVPTSFTIFAASAMNKYGWLDPKQFITTDENRCPDSPVRICVYAPCVSPVRRQRAPVTSPAYRQLLAPYFKRESV
jgi:hypothetical protein